jgi:dihydrofolate reductase
VAAQKRVISQSLAAIDQPRTSIGRGSLLDEVTTLKRQTGGDIICFGGVSFAAGLLDAGVVDELQFYVNPYAVGEGASIFSRARPLRCIDATAYGCGIVVQRYLPS